MISAFARLAPAAALAAVLITSLAPIGSAQAAPEPDASGSASDTAAAERESSLKSDAKMLATNLETMYVDARTYPRTWGDYKKMAKEQNFGETVLSEGNRVAFYRGLLNKQKGVQRGYWFCLRNTDGGFVTYRSDKSGVVAASGVTQSCGTPESDGTTRVDSAAKDARVLGLTIEGLAVEDGVYPTNRDQFRRMVGDRFNYGEQVWAYTYTYLPATRRAPTAFKLCTAHYDGGYAVYNSRRGGIVNKAETGTCPS